MAKMTILKCDVCGEPAQLEDRNVFIVFTTEQTEGRSVEPYPRENRELRDAQRALDQERNKIARLEAQNAKLEAEVKRLNGILEGVCDSYERQLSSTRAAKER